MIFSIRIIDYLTYKALHKDTINAVFLHPFEMKQHTRLIVSTVHLSCFTIGQYKFRRATFRSIYTRSVSLFIFRHIGPHINRVLQNSRLEHFTFTIVIPSRVIRIAMPASVTRRTKPSLIACHHQATIGIERFAVFMEFKIRLIINIFCRRCFWLFYCRWNIVTFVITTGY